MEKSPEAFRTISEVAEWLDVPTHVLRFWESRFSQVKPVKRAGGRRYYRPSDMLLIGGIKRLLHDDGMTIRGVQKLLREEGVKHVASFSQPLEHEKAAAIESTAEAPPENEVISLIRQAAGAAEREEAADRNFAAAEEPEAAPEPAAQEPPRVATFGTVRRPAPEPELPFDASAPEADLVDEADLERAAEPEPEAEAPAPPEPAPEPAAETPRIPSTPDVPETDPEDDAPSHAAAPGLAARLLIRRAGPRPDRPVLEEVVAALRAVRDRDAV